MDTPSGQQRMRDIGGVEQYFKRTNMVSLSKYPTYKARISMEEYPPVVDLEARRGMKARDGDGFGQKEIQSSGKAFVAKC